MSQCNLTFVNITFDRQHELSYLVAIVISLPLPLPSLPLPLYSSTPLSSSPTSYIIFFQPQQAEYEDDTEATHTGKHELKQGKYGDDPLATHIQHFYAHAYQVFIFILKGSEGKGREGRIERRGRGEKDVVVVD